jgi:hypothetical protein
MHTFIAIGSFIIASTSNRPEGWIQQYVSTGPPYVYNVTYTGTYNSSGLFYNDVDDFWNVTDIATPTPQPSVEPFWHYGLDLLGYDSERFRYGVQGTPNAPASFTVTYYDGDTWYRGIREGWMYVPSYQHWEREKLYFRSTGIVLGD